LAKFVKGQSGNPGGQPKEIKEIAGLARNLCPEAIERLAFWMRSDNAKASVAAANALLNRGVGMPKQEITGECGAPFTIQVVRGAVPNA